MPRRRRSSWSLYLPGFGSAPEPEDSPPRVLTPELVQRLAELDESDDEDAWEYARALSREMELVRCEALARIAQSRSLRAGAGIYHPALCTDESVARAERLARRARRPERGNIGAARHGPEPS